MAMVLTNLLEPGQLFAGRYRIERMLAKGGMGALFVAEQIATELPVAVKVLWPHILGTKDAVEKFQLEAKVAARVQSEQIVRVLDAGFDETTQLPFLVMELLKGDTLEHVVERSGPLSPATTVNYMRQVAIGLDMAHNHIGKDGVRRAIVHRDLKPENLFLTHRQNGEPVVKILDFGIAKVVTDTTNLSQEIRGTPLYMAFEQAAGKAVSPQTDVWALGLISYFLLTGRTYWNTPQNEHGSMSSLLAEIINLPIDAPSERWDPGAPQPAWLSAFDAWFLRCVNRDPDARFASAGQAIDALAVALLGDQASTDARAHVATAETVSSTDQVQEALQVAAESHPSLSPEPATARTADRMALSHTAPTADGGSEKRSLVYLAAASAAAMLLAGGIYLWWEPEPTATGAEGLTTMGMPSATAAGLPAGPQVTTVVEPNAGDAPLVEPADSAAFSEPTVRPAETAATPPSAAAPAVHAPAGKAPAADSATHHKPPSSASPGAAEKRKVDKPEKEEKEEDVYDSR